MKFRVPEANADRFNQLDDIAQDNPLAAISQDEQIEHQAMAFSKPKHQTANHYKNNSYLRI